MSIRIVQHQKYIKRLIPWGPWGLALLLWVYSWQFFNLRAMNDLGLISIFPYSIVFAYIFVLLGFAYTLVRPSLDELSLTFYVLLLIFMLHGTPQILYGTLRYSWAWKHVGIVDYIIRKGSVDPNIAILNVYHDWPGFFALSALFTQLAGFSGAQVFAGWAPAFYETLFALGLLSLFRCFTPNVRLRYLGTWIFILANWIGQDYFSPQATTYFMFIGVLLMVLLGFGSTGPVKLMDWRGRFFSKARAKKFVLPIAKWIADLRITIIPREVELGRFQHSALGGIILVCFLMIASSHQLTPNVCFEFVTILVIFGYTRWKTLPIWMIAFIVFWILIPAKSYNNEIVKSIFSAYGQVTNNIDSGLINVAQVSSGQVIVSWGGRILTGLIGILGMLGILQRIRYRYFDLPVILFAGLPALTAFVNAYGGELIFRVYFFSLPALSFLAAGLFLPDEHLKTAWIKFLLISLTSGVLLIGFLLGYYGKEQQYYFTQAEVDAAEYVYSHAVPNSLLIEGSRNYPSQFLNYEYFTYIPLDREPVGSQSDFLSNPVAVFRRWMANSDYSTSILIITRSQKISTDTLGTLPRGSLEKIETELRNSDIFQVVYSNQDAVVFKLKAGK